MAGKPNMNSVAERRNQTLKDMLTRPLMNFGLAKIQASNICTFVVIQLKHNLINRMKEKWILEWLVVILLAMMNTLETPMKFGLAKIQASNTYTFGVVQLKYNLIDRMKEN
ncbi:hypothetical protein CR513_27722, partial [Mucuna pruriens]